MQNDAVRAMEAELKRSQAQDDPGIDAAAYRDGLRFALRQLSPSPVQEQTNG
jgi:hypothetical protein